MAKNIEYWQVQKKLEALFKKYIPFADKYGFFQVELDPFPLRGYWHARFYAELGPLSRDIKHEPAEILLRKIGSIRSLDVIVTDYDKVDIVVNGSSLVLITYADFETYGKKFIKEALAYMVKQYIPEEAVL